MWWRSQTRAPALRRVITLPPQPTLANSWWGGSPQTGGVLCRRLQWGEVMSYSSWCSALRKQTQALNEASLRFTFGCFLSQRRQQIEGMDTRAETKANGNNEYRKNEWIMTCIYITRIYSTTITTMLFSISQLFFSVDQNKNGLMSHQR